MHYNTNFNCTYKIKDDDTIYRRELLLALNLNTYNDKKIMDKIDKLYFILKDNEPLMSISKKCANKVLSEDQEIGFILLFSETTFFLLHESLQEFFTLGEISGERIEKLNQLLEK